MNTTITMRKLILLTVLVIMISCKSTQKVTKVNQGDPEEVAEAVLGFYKNKDLESLRYLSTHQKSILIQRLVLANDQVSIGKVFSGWRWESINQWDGKIKEVRFPDNLKRAYALFDLSENTSPTSSVTVVTMISENKKWKFDDIQKYTKQGFESLGYIME